MRSQYRVISRDRHFPAIFHICFIWGECTSYCTYHAVRDLMQKHSKYLLQGKCKSAGETKKSKEMHRLKSVRGGGDSHVKGAGMLVTSL